MIINSSRKAFEVLRKKVNFLQEEVWLLTLDANLKLMEIDLIFRGTVNECVIHPRDLVRTVCSRNASAFLLAHNHPSGRVQPSREDKIVTQKIVKVSRLLEVPMQDHLIFSAEKYFSFADKGMYFPMSLYKN